VTAPTLSVVIPVYNEEGTIEAVIRRVEGSLPDVAKEIVVSNDGSTDGTGEILRKAEAAGRIRLHDAVQNRGKGAAIRAGLELARGTVIVIQDADLEMDPADYPLMLRPILAGDAGVVYGSRFLARPPWRGPFLSGLANRVITATANLLYGSQLTDVETCYKMFRRDLLSRVRLTSDRFDFEPEVSGKLLRAGIDILEVPISYAPRTHAEGKKVRWRDGVDALAVLVRCRFMPLAGILRAEGEAAA
jgi:glycosyltransferase involved in cell wall biosynthesis